MKILTISIAAYNMQAYIREALDSLTDERVVGDLEVFVVDDGGTDRTLEIAKEYAAKYPDSIFPIHKENGGYGTTVNYSIAHATGKYFKLLDGDDWFDGEGLYQLVSRLKTIDSDMIVSPYCRVLEKGEKTTVQKKSFDVCWGEEIQFASFQVRESLQFPMHSITYKTRVLRESHLELPEKYLFTDGIYATVPVSQCETLFFLNANVYRYRIGREGQSVSRAARARHREDCEQVALICCEYYENLKRKSGNNLHYIRLEAAVVCEIAYRAILFCPVCKASLCEFYEFDQKVKAVSEDIFYAVESVGKLGRLMKVFRKTHFLPYWLLKLVPGGFPYFM